MILILHESILFSYKTFENTLISYQENEQYRFIFYVFKHFLYQKLENAPKYMMDAVLLGYQNQWYCGLYADHTLVNVANPDRCLKD